MLMLHALLQLRRPQLRGCTSGPHTYSMCCTCSTHTYLRFEHDWQFDESGDATHVLLCVPPGTRHGMHLHHPNDSRLPTEQGSVLESHSLRCRQGGLRLKLLWRSYLTEAVHLSCRQRIQETAALHVCCCSG
jgi:hypothetical protein